MILTQITQHTEEFNEALDRHQRHRTLSCLSYEQFHTSICRSIPVPKHLNTNDKKRSISQAYSADDVDQCILLLQH